MEQWEDITGYEGTHQVSSYGRVRSLDRVTDSGRKASGVMLVPQADKDGYLDIGIKKNGVRKHHRVNRLVALAFVGNPNNYPVAGHADDNRTNNHYTNIYWTTVEENMMHNGRSKRIAEAQSVQVKGTGGDSVVIFDSMADARRCGFSSSAIGQSVAGKRKTHRGYRWSVAT